GDVLLFERFEARPFRSDVVGVGNQVGHTIVAVSVGGGLERGALSRRGNGDFRARNGCTRRVSDCSENAPVNCLSGSLGHQQNANQAEYDRHTQNDQKLISHLQPPHLCLVGTKLTPTSAHIFHLNGFHSSSQE